MPIIRIRKGTEKPITRRLSEDPKYPGKRGTPIINHLTSGISGEGLLLRRGTGVAAEAVPLGGGSIHPKRTFRNGAGM